MAPSGTLPIDFILVIKYWVSLMHDLMWGTYPLICSSTNLLILLVGWLTELQMGLPGIPSLWNFLEKIKYTFTLIINAEVIKIVINN